MKTRNVLLIFAFVLSMNANLHAQVTIGSANNPKDGAILDLNNGAQGGLILSNVNLTDPGEIPVDFPGMAGLDDASIAAAKKQLKGAMIYNTNEDICVGIYVWDGARWMRLGSEDNPLVTGECELKITSHDGDPTKIIGDDPVEFTLMSPPSGIKSYTWYMSQGNDATYECIGSTVLPSFSRVFPAGNYKVKVVFDIDCQSLEESKNVVEFAAGSTSPSFGSTKGGNYIYIYGDFPYAASSDYEPEGLVLHFDGINNTGEGDKLHSNIQNTWIDLITGYTVTLTGTPGASAKWSGNGYTLHTAYFEGGLLPVTTGEGATPFGDSERTIESVFLTPDDQTKLNAAFNNASGVFVYGGGTPNPGDTYIGQIYHGGPNRFIGINTRGQHDLDFNVSATNPLTKPNSINTVSSEYIPNPAGVEVTGDACNFQGRLYVNSDLMVSGKLSSAGIKPPTALSIPPCGINTINAWARIGRRDGGVLNDYKVLSVRLYNRALTKEELEKNSEVDQTRFIAPPVVTIGTNDCADVVVLSPHFLMCKVPEVDAADLGSKDILVKSADGKTTYAEAAQGYTYVNATSAFYITTIDPITGPLAGGTLTFTGNKLDKITNVMVGAGSCNKSGIPTSAEYKCTLPVATSPGEVDITIIEESTGTPETHRFAKMFEYK